MSDIYEEKIFSIELIGRLKAKMFIKDCDLCESDFKTKKPLFRLEIHHLKNGKYITFSTHIFTQESLNKKLNSLVINKSHVRAWE